MTATNGKAKSDERKPCAAEKRQPIPKRISGDGSAPPRFRPVLFRLSVGVCAWLRRPRAQRAADGAASAAPSPNCHIIYYGRIDNYSCIQLLLMVIFYSEYVMLMKKDHHI